MKIKAILGREIYNSRGWPTVQCELILENDRSIYASVPTGLSQGSHEARKTYDEQERLWGRGVLQSVEYIDTVIAQELVGREPHAINMDLELIKLDGTADKSHLGANTMLAVSMAVYRAHAYLERIELFEFIGHVCGADTVTLPFPFFNMINGGMHANNKLRIQEFMVVPVGMPDFRTSMEVSATIFHELRTSLKNHKKMISFGDEGGYASQFSNDEEALDILSETVQRVHTMYGFHSLIALDVAATGFYDANKKYYEWHGEKLMTEELVARYEKLVDQYPICSIEDGLAEDDWDGWVYMVQRLKGKVQIIGDDLFVTNPTRISQGIELGAANGAVIKPDQIGTITETLQAIRLCHENNITTTVSHRSGDTEDAFIADLAVGTSSGQIKSGGLCRSERLAKYNRLLLIEDHLASEL